MSVVPAKRIRECPSDSVFLPLVRPSTPKNSATQSRRRSCATAGRHRSRRTGSGSVDAAGQLIVTKFAAEESMVIGSEYVPITDRARPSTVDTDVCWPSSIWTTCCTAPLPVTSSLLR